MRVGYEGSMVFNLTQGWKIETIKHVSDVNSLEDGEAFEVEKRKWGGWNRRPTRHPDLQTATDELRTLRQQTHGVMQTQPLP